MKRRRALMLAAVLLVLVGCDGGSWSSGDRVLVAKCLYETDLQKPRRYDVVVFKYPKGPVENGSPKNYIKRLLGLPGQILAIFFGQLFWWEPPEGQPPLYQKEDSGVNPLDLWQEPYMHVDQEKSRERFEKGEFNIMRKPPDIMMALRRIVYDNDFQASDLGLAFKRWRPPADSRWNADDDFRTFRHAGEAGKGIDWIYYQHLLRQNGAGDEAKASLITDFEAYNAFKLSQGGRDPPLPNWVGDLMLDCRVTVDRPQGSFYLALSRGVYRYRARFDLEKGSCTLLRQGPADKQEDKWEELASKPADMKNPGTYSLRFANFDSRLTVWLQERLLFGDGVDYAPPEMRAKGEKAEDAAKRRGPTRNDLDEPAGIGSDGAAVQVQKLQLWRDTYYTLSADDPGDVHLSDDDWTKPEAWQPIRELRYKTMYVQPGHYLCLGDNSPASSDSRHWGLVPQRLMLGRALLKYFPFDRAGIIR